MVNCYLCSLVCIILECFGGRGHVKRKIKIFHIFLLEFPLYSNSSQGFFSSRLESSSGIVSSSEDWVKCTEDTSGFTGIYLTGPPGVGIEVCVLPRMGSHDSLS